MSGWAAFGQALTEIGGKLHDSYDRRKESDTEWHRQAQMAQQGIQWKVADAKAAGIHPLYALGASTHSYQPQAVMSGGSWQDVGRSIGARVDQQREAARLAAAQAESQTARDAAELRTQQEHDSRMRTEALQRALLEKQLLGQPTASAASLATQPGHGVAMPTSAANLFSSGVGGQRSMLKPGVAVKADEVTAGKGGRTAGVHQGATDYELPLGGRGAARVTLPSEQVTEALEDMELAKYALMISLNRDRIANFFTSDIPWAVKGYADDWGLTKWLHSKRKPSVYERLTGRR